MKNKIIISLCSLVLVMSAAKAEEKILTPKDFFKGSKIQLEPGNAIYELDLNESVYQLLQRADQGDLRVFNASNETVPHLIQSQSKEEFIKTSALKTLPIFPLYDDSDVSLDELSLHINKSKSGSIVDIKMANGAKQKIGKNLVAYLVDVTRFKDSIYSLHVDWRATDGDGMVANLSVEASDNLENWRMIKSDGVVARLNYLNHFLDRNIIKLGSLKTKYLRLSWPKTNKNFSVNGLKASFNMSKQPVLTYQWSRITGKPDPDKDNTFLFDVGGHVPATVARVILPEKNMALKVNLFSINKLSNHPEHKSSKKIFSSDRHRILTKRKNYQFQPRWQRRHHNFLAYDLEIGGTTLLSPKMILTQKTNDRYWRIEVKDPGSSLANGKVPILELGWLPEKLTFLARGKPPYLLAVGNEEITPAKFAMHQLMQTMGDKKIKPEAAAIKEFEVLSAQNVQDEIKILTVPLARLILWSVLVLGVLLLGWMALRLFKQMNETN